ncbi:hypothetical protein J1614_000754 [Plenodomus biglobosus]|nr:hypothetical protein J1614_000754 [Plenodomus biglobosus]
MSTSSNVGAMVCRRSTNDQPAVSLYNSRARPSRYGSIPQLESIQQGIPDVPVGPRAARQSRLCSQRTSQPNAARDMRMPEQFAAPSMEICQNNVNTNDDSRLNVQISTSQITISRGSIRIIQTNINCNGPSFMSNTASDVPRSTRASSANISSQSDGPLPLVAGTAHGTASHSNDNMRHDTRDLRAIRPSTVYPRPSRNGVVHHSANQPARSSRHITMSPPASSVHSPLTAQHISAPSHAAFPTHIPRSPPTPSSTAPAAFDFHAQAPPGSRAIVFIARCTEPLTAGAEVANSECPVCLEPADRHARGCVQIKRGRGCNHMIGRDCLEAMLMDQPDNRKLCPLCRATWMRGSGYGQNDEHGYAVLGLRYNRRRGLGP